MDIYIVGITLLAVVLAADFFFFGFIANLFGGKPRRTPTVQPVVKKETVQSSKPTADNKKAGTKRGPEPGYDPLVGAAIKEIKMQLALQGGSGKVAIDDWQTKFSKLGTLKAFLESRTDKFKITSDENGELLVQLLQGPRANGHDRVTANAVTEIKAKLREQGGQGKPDIEDWNDRFGQLGTQKDFVLSRPDKFNVISDDEQGLVVKIVYGQGEKGTGKGEKGEKKDPVVASAVTEIKAQLREQGGQGKVVIDDWTDRFEQLGPMRSFVESRPDKFKIISDDDQGLVLKIVWPANTSGSQSQSSYVEWDSYDRCVASAITEIKTQLREQGGQGKIVIADWEKRYLPLLGTLRNFLLCRPDKFNVLSDGATVELVNPAPVSYEWNGAKGAGKTDPAVGAAISEIKEQLRWAGGHGKVWIQDWNEKYGHLGSLRQFLESRPDKFQVVPEQPWQGRGFTVSLRGKGKSGK